MDLTDITIGPMIPAAIGVVLTAIKAHTGWSWVASLGAALIPGAVIGFAVGVFLFWTISGITWMFLRITGRLPTGPPK
jgi:hypothetical protein